MLCLPRKYSRKDSVQHGIFKGAGSGVLSRAFTWVGLIVYPLDVTTLAAQLGFEVPQGAHWLVVLAGALLVLEVVLLVGGIWRRNAPGPAALRTLGAAAGPLTVAGALVYAVMTAVGGQALRGIGMLRLAAHATVLQILGLLLWLGLPARWPHVSLVVLTVEALLWAVRSYRRTTRPVGWLSKRTLLALRVLVILLLGLYAARPSLAYQRTRQVRRVVLVGIDSSASMRRQDMPADYLQQEITAQDVLVPRIQAVRSALEQRWGLLEDLAETTDIRFFLFSSSASPALGLDDPQLKARLMTAPADGQATALADSVLGALGQMDRSRREIASIVVLTDGNQNTVRQYDLERMMEDLSLRDIPLYTVGVGWETVTPSTRGLQVSGLTSDDEVNAFHRLAIDAEIRAIGLAGRQVEVTCLFGDEEVETVLRDIRQDNQTLDLRFVHIPLQAGYHRLTVQAQLVGQAPRNLEVVSPASKLVHVVDRGIRVLYVDGKKRYEVKYVGGALASSERIEVDRHLLLRPAGPEGNGLSDNPEDWLIYHAILLGNVPPNRFTPAQREIMKTLVDEKGKGLAMFGEQLGSGQWAGTVLGDVLPVDLSAGRGKIERPVEILPTREGVRAELMSIGKAGQDTMQAWQELDPLEGADVLVPKQGALVLAESQRQEPMIVQGRYGAGRTLAIAFDTTWQWSLTPPGTETAEYQKRFWRQVALYLAAPKGNIWITTDQAVYDQQGLATGREVVEITAGIENAAGLPLFDVPDQKVTLTDPEGRTVPIELMARERMRSGKLVDPPTRTGTYVLRIEGTVDDKVLQAEHRFEVIQRDLEGREVLADHDRLRNMARRPGVSFYKLAELGDLLEKLPDRARPRLETIDDPRPLWEEFAWPVAAVVVGLLCAEWMWRKRKGLV
jgi:hypothetical protein